MQEEEMLKELTTLIEQINMSANYMLDNIVELKKKSLLQTGSKNNFINHFKEGEF